MSCTSSAAFAWSISASDTYEITEPSLAAGHRHMANRVVGQLKSMTRWAKRQKGYIDADPLVDAGKPAEEFERAKRTLNNDELVLFQRRLEIAITESPRRKVLSALTIRRILMLIVLTGGRPGEICGMRKSEIDPDIGTFSMTDPLRCKNRLPHKFHLSGPAREIVKAALADAKGSKFVFPTAGKRPHVQIENVDKVLERAVTPSKDHPAGRFGIAPFARRTICGEAFSTA